MGRLSLGQKAIVLAVLAAIGIVAVAVFLVTGLGGKVLAVLLLGTCLSAGFKVLHM